MKLAAIDIGSNSIKLAVVDAAANTFTLLVSEKEVVRLGRDTLRDNHLAPAAIERAAECIARYRQMAENHGAASIIAIATASVREADNAAEFVGEVERRAGVRVEILSGIEEARLIGLAAARGCSSSGGGGDGGTDVSLLNIDIGGGSTEISLVENSTPTKLFSVKLGAVGLTDKFVFSDPIKNRELRALQDEVRHALERPARELRGAKWNRTTGTSGTIIALGETLHLHRMPNERRPTNGGALPPLLLQPPPLTQLNAASSFTTRLIAMDELARFNKRMAALSVVERRKVPGISQQRAEIIIAGGQILEGAMRALGVSRLATCHYALREGAIIDLLHEIEAEARPPVPDEADPRLDGVHQLGLRFNYEEAHAYQVARLAELLFDQLVPLHKLGRSQRTLLSAAALLHDVGYIISHESHHKHSLYLIKHSELTGFTEPERLIIANVARYHRRSMPKERHPDYAALSEAERKVVCQLGGILRVADALDRSHESRVRDVRVALLGTDAVQLTLQSEVECDDELWAANQKRDMFEQAFACKIAFNQQAPAAAVVST